jgi:flagellar hook-basal body complex protein FliE
VRVLTAEAATPSSTTNDSSSSSSGSWYKRVQAPYSSTRAAATTAAGAALRSVKLKDFPELRDIVQQYGAVADLSTLLAMFSRLRTVTWHPAKDKAGLLEQLWELLKPHLQQQQQQQQQQQPQQLIGQALESQQQQQQRQRQQQQQRIAGSPRHCAEAMLAASKLQHAPAGLYKTCLAAFKTKVAAADSRVLANAIYAVATAPSDVKVAYKQDVERVLLPAFVLLARKAAPQAVSNVAYAVALLGCNGVLLQQLLKAVPSSTWREATTQVITM